MLNDNDRGEVLKSYKSKGGRKKLAAFEDHFFKNVKSSSSKKLEHFSLNSLSQFSKEELEFHGSRSTLYKILKSMGFRYKLENHRKILIERPFITAKRIKFLTQYLRYKEMYPNSYKIHLFR
jgi:hypothetical protein